jgi:hypothetical protein
MPVMTPTLLVLAALGLFQLKHYFCDFVTQTQRQLGAKGNYGHLGGIEHAGLHAIGSIPALLVLTTALPIIALAVAAEFVVHYHIDYFKARIDRRFAFRNTSRPYWAVFGFDQLLHQATYLTLTTLLVLR